MGDSHKGPNSLDARFAAVADRVIRPRLPALIAITSAALTATWYANHWTDIYIRAQRTLHGNGDPDLIMGLVSAVIFTLGFATSALIRFLPPAP